MACGMGYVPGFNVPKIRRITRKRFSWEAPDDPEEEDTSTGGYCVPECLDESTPKRRRKCQDAVDACECLRRVVERGLIRLGDLPLSIIAACLSYPDCLKLPTVGRGVADALRKRRCPIDFSYQERRVRAADLKRCLCGGYFRLTNVCMQHASVLKEISRHGYMF